MTQNPFQDIVPPEKRTIRNVAPVHHNSRRPVQQVRPPRRRSPISLKSKRFPIKIWVVGLLSIFILFFIFSFLFAGAKVIVLPKQNQAFVDAQFEALREAPAGMLAYENMSIEKIGFKSISATGEEEVEIKASGKIVIFNNHDSASQRLIKNTRFETPDGLIYRIDKSIVVPGRKTTDGRVVPGSIEATVYADEPGEGYNIGLTDFTIPGFKGSPRFEGFFARSKTSITGGFVGKRLVVEEKALKDAKEEIQTNLKSVLLNEAFAQKPDGFYLYEDTIFVDFESLPSIDKGESVEIQEKGILYGVLFKEDDFAQYLAQNTLGSYDDSLIELINAADLVLTTFEKENARPWEEDSFTFVINGTADFVWFFDEEQLKSDLLGRSKDALATILSGYPSIDQAEVILRPFWKRTFPEKASKIKIIRELEE